MLITKALRQFIIRSLIIFTFWGAVCASVFYWYAPQHYFGFVPAIFIYFFILNIIVFRFLINSSELSIQAFSKRFVILTFVKFFGSFLLVSLFLFYNPTRVVPFLMIFIILYFSSLFQEVHEFLRFLKKRSAK
jgi:hypothetical protein